MHFPIPNIFFNSSKMVNLIQLIKKRRRTQRMEIASFHEFGHMSIVVLLSNTTEHYFLF